jgi:hypothetical protein
MKTPLKMQEKMGNETLSNSATIRALRARGEACCSRLHVDGCAGAREEWAGHRNVKPRARRKSTGRKVRRRRQLCRVVTRVGVGRAAGCRCRACRR